MSATPEAGFHFYLQCTIRQLAPETPAKLLVIWMILTEGRGKIY